MSEELFSTACSHFYLKHEYFLLKFTVQPVFVLRIVTVIIHKYTDM